MSTSIESESAPGELAPSERVVSVPVLSRGLGMVGTMFVVAGLVSVVAASQEYPTFFGPNWGYLVGTLGLSLMLVHAIRDADPEVRRLYGGLAFALLAAAVVVSLYPNKDGAAARHVGQLLLPWGATLGFLSLVFFVPFSRHEDAPEYRRVIEATLLSAGASLVISSVAAGVLVPDFLAGPAIVLGLLGLGFLCAYFAQTDTSDGLGYRVALGLGAVGLVALTVAAGRSIVPGVLHEGPAALRSGLQTLDTGKVALRLASVAACLGVAALAFVKALPLWVRSALAVIGLAFAAAFAVGSFTRLIVPPPQPFLVPYGLILAALGVVYVAFAVATVSENALVVMTRRELTAYFYSPIAYLVLFAVALVAWFGYAWFVSELHTNMADGRQTPEPILAGYSSLGGIVAGIVATFLVPALTMGLLAEERRTGTLEVLLTAPVSEWTIVASKFLGSWLFFMVCWLPPGLYLIALRAVTGEPFDYRPLLSFYLALGCSGAAFVAMGLFFSSLTRNQIVAAVLTFAGMMFLLLAVLAPQFARLEEGAGQGGFVSTAAAVVERMSYLNLWRQAVSGQLMVRAIAVQLSLAVLWLFLSVKSLELRKWS